MADNGDFDGPAGAAGPAAASAAAPSPVPGMRSISVQITNPSPQQDYVVGPPPPDSGYTWDPANNIFRRLTTLLELGSLCDILTYASNHIPEGGAARAVWGALVPIPADFTLASTEEMILTEDSEVNAWHEVTKDDPPAVHIILHHDGAGDNTRQMPPHEGEQAHISKRYFDSLLVDAEEESDDDNCPVRKKFKPLPRTDRGF